MKVENTVSSKAADAAYIVLSGFLNEGGNIPGLDNDLIMEFIQALSADRIVIAD